MQRPSRGGQCQPEQTARSRNVGCSVTVGEGVHLSASPASPLPQVGEKHKTRICRSRRLMGVHTGFDLGQSCINMRE